ncbi:hypothetical protein GCM10023232_08870 [Sphingosinicella ginsenosidimutans]|nr:Ivy family c-type lysozyme inhibitor [Sphingosinicella ginsenosidimutans]
MVRFLALPLVLLGAPILAQPAADWTSAVSSPSLALARHPREARAWQSVVPPSYRRTRWIYRLEGNSSQPRIVQSGGRSYVLGTVCKPHDCYANVGAFLIALDGRRAAGGLLFNRAGRSREIYFGNPSPYERALLRSILMLGQ